MRFFFLFSLVILRCKMRCILRCKSRPGGFSCQKHLSSGFQQTVRSLWAASCPKRLAFSMTGCLVFLRRTFQIPGTQNSQRHFFTIVRIRETTEWLFPATQPLNLDYNCHGFWRRNSRKHVAAFHHDPNLFIIIPLQADSTSKKKEKKKGEKNITSCILWFRCATFLIYASTKAPTGKNIQCGWSGILEVGLSDGAPAGSHNLTSCKPHVAKHVSKWPDRSNVSHVLSSWEPWKKRERRKLTHPAS